MTVTVTGTQGFKVTTFFTEHFGCFYALVPSIFVQIYIHVCLCAFSVCLFLYILYGPWCLQWNWWWWWWWWWWSTTTTTTTMMMKCPPLRYVTQHTAVLIILQTIITDIYWSVVNWHELSTLWKTGRVYSQYVLWEIAVYSDSNDCRSSGDRSDLPSPVEQVTHIDHLRHRYTPYLTLHQHHNNSLQNSPSGW